MYTLKLDLSEYELDVLTTLLKTDHERSMREETTGSSWNVAVNKIYDDIQGYRTATAQAKSIGDGS